MHRSVRGLVLGMSLLAACGDDAASPMTDAGGRTDAGMEADGGGGTDAGVPSHVLITAAEGGLVVAPDQLFALYVPPGALAADTEIGIEIVPAAMRPPEAAGALGEVYDVQPEGLTFAMPAT